MSLWVLNMELAEYTVLGVGLYLQPVDVSLFFLSLVVQNMASYPSTYERK